MKEVTIQDIAQRAAVSKSTVSRVLNGTTAVNPEKKQAVLDAAKELGFKPNFFAQSLASGKSMTIGVLTQIIGSPFYDAIAQGVISGLSGSGYSPLFVDGQWQQQEEVESIRALLGRRVDGLMLIGGSVPHDELADLCGDTPRIVVARQLPGEQHVCVAIDNFSGGLQAIEHLIENGHRKIAFIHGVSHHPDAADRLNGYKMALQNAGIPFDSEMILEGDFTSESAVEALDQLIRSGTKFTAVFTSNDMMAFGARLALSRHNLRVPEDVSMVGYDDQAESAFMIPPLTTVRQPAREMGAEAAKGLLALIQGNEYTPANLEVELMKRESVAKIK